MNVGAQKTIRNKVVIYRNKLKDHQLNPSNFAADYQDPHLKRSGRFNIFFNRYKSRYEK